MRSLAYVLLGTLLATGPVLAQTASPNNAGVRRPVARTARPMMRRQGNPDDAGPYTPEANRAYQGGGMVLEGAPGAPTPMPQAMPSQPMGRMAPAR